MVCVSNKIMWPFFRASISSTKDRLDSLEKKFQVNRQNMTKQAKKAAKLEKKLKLLTGGYQSRATSLTKQLIDIHDQCEQSFIEMNTFKCLQSTEGQAIPSRLEVSQFNTRCRNGGVRVHLRVGSMHSKPVWNLECMFSLAPKIRCGVVVSSKPEVFLYLQEVKEASAKLV